MGDNNRRSERGMVSILVTMIMMIVISLIILGISQITRSNRREQLDQQLAAQAYYAAESGINQAVSYLAANPTYSTNTNGRCGDFITTAGLNSTLNGGSKVSYTCLMVNPTPTSLQKAPLTQDSNTVWLVKNAAGAAFNQLEFKWVSNNTSQFSGASNTCSAAMGSAINFTKWNNWNCAFGILRVDMVPTSGGAIPASTLQAPARTLYLVPSYGSSTTTTVLSGNAQVIYAKCEAATKLCSMKLTGHGTTSEYFVRLSMIYQDADSVQLTATDTTGTVRFSGGQAVIDVTGKAQDQLRRIQARIPLTAGNTPMPNFALQSTQPICKQLAVGPGLTTANSCP